MVNFFIFSLILVSSFTIIFATNVVYAVLQLIVTYTLVSFRLIFLDLEFFSTVFVIVCAGGMGVLFLFVIMTFSKRASNPFFLLPYYNQFFIIALLYVFGLMF
jgi:NADH:ubiquinone oxidoreductase subunit 6 (subunit J)